MMRSRLSVKMAHPTHFFSSTLTADLSLSVIVGLKGMLIKGEWGIGNGVNQIFAVSSSHQSGHRIGVKQIFAVSSSHQSDHRIGVKQIFAVCRRYQLDHSVGVYPQRWGYCPSKLVSHVMEWGYQKMLQWNQANIEADWEWHRQRTVILFICLSYLLTSFVSIGKLMISNAIWPAVYHLLGDFLFRIFFQTQN